MNCYWDHALLGLGEKFPSEFCDIIRHGSHEQYLDAVTRISRDARFTYLMFTHCESLFPHICASLLDHAEVSSGIALIARVIHLAPYLHPYAEALLAKTPVRTATFSRDEDGVQYLLALFRLLKHDRRTFVKYVNSAILVGLLQHQCKPIVYLAIRILQIRLCGADAWFEGMRMKYLGPDEPDVSLSGLWDDQAIDYRFLPLWEEQRVERVDKMVSSTQSRILSSYEEPCRTVPERLFHKSTALIGNILLPRTESLSPKGVALAETFVYTDTIIRNLGNFAEALKSLCPVLLAGLAGSGKTHLVRQVAQRLGKLDTMITLHLNEQSDAKTLLGVYSTGGTPGSFTWQPGVLTTAVEEGRWILIEDIDRAPNDIIGMLLPLIEKRQLLIPNRRKTIEAAPGFQLVATVRSIVNHRGEERHSISMLGLRHWAQVSLRIPNTHELEAIVGERFPSLLALLPQLVAVYRRLERSTQHPVLIGQSQTGILRPTTIRDLLKWCNRILALGQSRSQFTSNDMDNIFLEAVDCFVGALSNGTAKDCIIAEIAQVLRIDPQRWNFLVAERNPNYEVGKASIIIGRQQLSRMHVVETVTDRLSYSINPYSTRILERLAVAISCGEPLLLVGETGVGKTTAAQHLARQVGQRLIPFNLSQQSEAVDLIGGYKPVNARTLMISLKEEFDELFTESFSISKNRQFLELLGKHMARSNWKTVCKLWRQALGMVDQQREPPRFHANDAPGKRRKLERSRQIDFARWDGFSKKIAEAEKRTSASFDAIAFQFVEGKLIEAVRKGYWVLLDEINLATPDTLEAISGLLDPNERSIILTEAGKVERIQAHEHFRVFGSMNPATDVGKKDLPPGIRSRFTEIYIDSPDKDLKSLQDIVSSYLRHYSTTDRSVALDVSTLYQQILNLTAQNRLIDGAGHKPSFSLRTLTRVLQFARHMAPLSSLRRALYEGFEMSFCTLLNAESANLVQPLLTNWLFSKQDHLRSELRKILKKPDDGHEYVQGCPGSKHWIRRGDRALEDQPLYILTRSILRNIENLIRAASTRQSPVLIQGPTSSGKTSMIQYLAKRTGNVFVRINNHEHTDLQEYLGTYVTGTDGRLSFQEGVLVKALRQGHWIVLDELNLAPTDVLEALNRLLDDNRELLIPETQEIVRPHDNFMLFATQNPAGIYGGRKILSRAFRNRFLELHFDDIPTDELQQILHQRTKLPMSRCKRIVAVYREMSTLRQETRLFEKQGFATLRDLFRWAMRPNDTIEELAVNGFMLLAERVRKPEERAILQGIIEKCMSIGGPRVHIDESIYAEDCKAIVDYKQNVSSQEVVWTAAMRRLYVLVYRAIESNEPVLLVGETGCGKTTVCQMLSDALKTQLHTINVHQNTETGDLIGSQRPIRNRAGIEQNLRTLLSRSSLIQQLEGDISALSTENLLTAYDRHLMALEGTAKHELKASSEYSEIQDLRTQFNALFQWTDGSLVHAMRTGTFFLLDEISLADDSVLERLNSVLEPERSILLAEKGSSEVFVKATPNFQIFATMNPGGDYGKRELSPALRNRFTEIWVPAAGNLDDVTQIVTAKLVPPAVPYSSAMVSFAKWFNNKFSTSAGTGISIRNALAWVTFVNIFADNDPVLAVVHGACMVFIDTLGANPSGLVKLGSNDLYADRYECLLELGRLLDVDALAVYTTSTSIRLEKDALFAGHFSIARRAGIPDQNLKFSFHPPTTAINTMRIIRALQLPKPVLLEGSPGVGKTALVMALAAAVGIPLTRINLSDQTDLLDLFGSDAPVDGASAGTFAWRDAPYLRAMKRGDWVLLDEMNLASQSILEGLNACLDHRGEVYIPELGQTFARHPDFRLFAAQNPHHQGGGRKGLPASFVNRFTVVYTDTLKAEDLLMICKHRFPEVNIRDLERAVEFISRLQAESQDQARFALGGPWEFNLRDISRWLSLTSSTSGLLKSSNASDFVDLLFSYRFRSEADRDHVRALFASVYQDTPFASNVFSSISSRTLQLGNVFVTRHSEFAAPPSSTWLPDGFDGLQILRSFILSIQQKWPVILVGESGSGKTALIERLACAVGARLQTIALNADTDVMDLIGGYEQADPQRRTEEMLTDFRELSSRYARSSFLEQDIISTELTIAAMDGEYMAREALSRITDALPPTLSAPATNILEQDLQVGKGRFEWVDGLLINALQEGKWLVLDNANLCNPSVLDRLNALLEPNGVLAVNENSAEDGSPRVIVPHKDFRIILTLDPQYGELSRAMRNRAVEIFVDRASNPGLSICVDPLWTDSTLARFRQARALSVANDQNQSRCVSIFQDHLAISDQPMIARFVHQCELGLLGASNPISVLPHSPWQMIIDQGHIEQFWHDITISMEDCTELSSIQTLHPLNNETLVFCASAGTRMAMLLAFAFDIEALLASMWVSLNRMQSDPVTVRLVRRNERLLGVESPAVGSTIIATLETVFENMLKGARYAFSSSEVAIEAFTQFLKEARALWQVLSSMASDKFFQSPDISSLVSVTASLRQRASLHDIVLDREIVPAILAPIETLLPPPTDIRGIACVVLWRTMRPKVPLTESQLRNVANLERLADRFDNASSYSKLDESIIHSRAGFEKALALASSGQHETSSLYEKLQHNLTQFTQISTHSRPHFYDAFSRLQQQLRLAGLVVPILSTSETIILDVFAGTPTSESAMALSSDPLSMSALLRGLGLLTRRVRVDPSQQDDSVDLSSSVLVQINAIDSVKLKDLDSFRAEIDHLGQIMARHANEIGIEHMASLQECMHRIFVSTVAALKLHEDHDVQNLSSVWLARIASLDRTDRGSLLINDDVEFESSANSSLSSADSAFQSVYSYLLSPSPSSTPGMKLAARAWISFALACLELYVPTMAFDPALEARMKLQVHQICKDEFNADIDALCTFQTKLSGRAESWRIRLLRAGLQALGPEPFVDPVYRPINSTITTLHVELGKLMQSVNSLEPSSLPLGMTKLENLTRIRQILHEKYPEYRDFTTPIIGLIDCLLVGHQLSIKFKARETQSSVRGTIASILPFARGSLESWLQVSQLMDAGNSTTSVAEICSWLKVMQLRSQVYPLAHDPPELQQAVELQFLRIYREWHVQLSDDRRREIAKTSLYRYRGDVSESEATDSEVNEMFPTGIDPSTNNIPGKRVHNSAYEIAELHGAIYASPKRVGTVADILLRWATIEVDKLGSVGPSDTLSAVLVAMHKLHQRLHQSANSPLQIDIYHDSNIHEVTRLSSVVSKARLRFLQLQNSWPDHATPVEVLRLCDSIEQISHLAPPMHFLPLLEKLHMTVNEWQRIASREYSANDVLEEIVGLIISWRQLELKSWSGLFDRELLQCKEAAASWWFVAYETIVVATDHLGTLSDTIKHVRSLVTTLTSFLLSSGMGEFTARIEMLRAFKAHLDTRETQDDNATLVRCALANLIEYHEPYEAVIATALTNGRSALEKKIQEIIKLSSWKNRNIDTLKQNAQSSHRKLFGLVRKYRQLLAQTVAPLISNGIPARETTPFTNQFRLNSSVQHVSGTSTAMSAYHVWNIRPARFMDSTRATELISRKASATYAVLDGATLVSSFTVDVLKSVASLQSETPRLLSDENKALVKHLKTRKRRLLADTLKNIRSMGFQSSLTESNLEKQSSLEKVLCSISPWPEDRNCERAKAVTHELNRFISLMPEIRNSVRKHSEDLMSEEVMRCLNLQESMLSELCRQRNALVESTSSYFGFVDTVNLLRNFCTARTGDIVSNSADRLRILLSEIAMLEHILQSAQDLISAQAELGNRDYSFALEVLRTHLTTLMKVKEEMLASPTLPKSLHSSKELAARDRYKSLRSDLLKSLRSVESKLPELGPLLSHIPRWIPQQHDASTTKNDYQFLTVDQWLAEYMACLDSMLGAIQDFAQVLEEFKKTDSENNWLKRQYSLLEQSSKALHVGFITHKLSALMQNLRYLSDKTPLSDIATMCENLLPIVSSYEDVVSTLSSIGYGMHVETSTMAYKLGTVFVNLAKDGFCTPAEKSETSEDQKGNLETGTGLGDGEGAEDISKDVGDDEDLSELAQQRTADDDGQSIEDAEDAVDMGADDLEGDVDSNSGFNEEGDHDGSENENEDADVDEEFGKVDDSGPSTVDEKMWDEQNNDRETDQQAPQKGGTADEDNVVAAEQNNEQSERTEKEQEVQSGEYEQPEDEVEHIDEQANDELEQPATEHDTLDIPDDIDMGEPQNDKDDDDSITGSTTSEQPLDDLEVENGPSGLNETIDSQSLDPEIQELDKGHEINEAGDTAESSIEDENMSDILMRDNEETGLDSTDNTIVGDTGNGADKVEDEGQNTRNAEHDTPDTEQEDHDVQGEAGASKGGNSGRKEDLPSNLDDGTQQRDRLPFKQMGDALDEWYNQQKAIESAREQGEDDHSDEQKDITNAKFEHLPDSGTAADAQALDAAAMEHSAPLNMEKAISVANETEERFQPDDLEMDQAQSKIESGDDQAPTDPLNAGQSESIPKAIIGQTQARDIDLVSADDLSSHDKHEFEGVDEQFTNTHISDELFSLLTATEAREQWEFHENKARPLALVLTEHLRLILQPTKATKLRGDFRTGKRLNIKRIIPYIASSFKRDKIWMRRSVPSKRTYQVMLAIDDSKSMSESGSGELAFETLVLVARSLSMLEVGELSVIAFGQDVVVARDFDSAFSAEIGAEVLSKFTFAQTKTNMQKLVTGSIELFRAARLKATGSASDLWQLQLIISDGVCEDHASIRQMVRQAQQERIMIVFIIVDALAQKKSTASTSGTSQSILDLPTAEFVKDENGEVQLKMGRYLDTFPFNYYLIVRDIQELPGVLAGALRQWFSEVVGTGV